MERASRIASRLTQMNRRSDSPFLRRTDTKLSISPPYLSTDVLMVIDIFQTRLYMATNSATLNSEIMARQARMSFEHRFFLTVAILFPIVIAIGFAPSYYFKPLFNTPPLPSGLVHAHGISMTAWMLLFLTQTYLITSKQIRLHMTLGMAGVALAIAMVVLGVMTGIEAGARGSAVPGFTPEQFLIVPIGDMSRPATPDREY